MFKFAAIFGTPFILVSLGSKGADVNILCENKQNKVYKLIIWHLYRYNNFFNYLEICSEAQHTV